MARLTKTYPITMLVLTIIVCILTYFAIKQDPIHSPTLLLIIGDTLMMVLTYLCYRGTKTGLPDITQKESRND